MQQPITALVKIRFGTQAYTRWISQCLYARVRHIFQSLALCYVARHVRCFVFYGWRTSLAKWHKLCNEEENTHHTHRKISDTLYICSHFVLIATNVRLGEKVCNKRWPSIGFSSEGPIVCQLICKSVGFVPHFLLFLPIFMLTDPSCNVMLPSSSGRKWPPTLKVETCQTIPFCSQLKKTVWRIHSSKAVGITFLFCKCIRNGQWMSTKEYACWKKCVLRIWWASGSLIGGGRVFFRLGAEWLKAHDPSVIKRTGGGTS